MMDGVVLAKAGTTSQQNDRMVVAISGSLATGLNRWEPAIALNLSRGSKDNIFGRGFFASNELGSEMPKAARLASTIPATYIVSKPITGDFDFSQFVPIALFSGIGLLVSLVAIVNGVQGGWY